MTRNKSDFLSPPLSIIVIKAFVLGSRQSCAYGRDIFVFGPGNSSEEASDPVKEEEDVSSVPFLATTKKHGLFSDTSESLSLFFFDMILNFVLKSFYETIFLGMFIKKRKETVGVASLEMDLGNGSWSCKNSFKLVVFSFLTRMEKKSNESPLLYI